MKFHPVRTEYRRGDGQTDKMKLTVAFRSFVNTPIKSAESYQKNASADETIFEEISGLECWDNKNIGRENYPSGEEKFVLTRCLVLEL